MTANPLPAALAPLAAEMATYLGVTQLTFRVGKPPYPNLLRCKRFG